MAASDHLSGVQFSHEPAGKWPTAYVYADADTRKHLPGEQPGRIGRIGWAERTGRITEVEVHPDYRHQGIATGMYHQATRANGRPLAHSPNRTEDGEGWARTVGGVLPPRSDINGR